jgi:plasmid stabilization system protein ParE
MKLILSRLALNELDDILGIIAARSPRAAQHVAERMRRAFAHIVRVPEAAQRIADRPHVRRLPLARYPFVIYYEIGFDAVTALHILHSARERAESDVHRS